MEFLFKGLGCAIAAYGAAYLITSILLPAHFLDIFSVNDAERRSGKGWRVRLRIGLAILGMGLFLNAGAYSIFSVIPVDWGNFNEDGEWEYTRGAFQLIFAGYATLMLVSSLDEKAEISASRDILLCKLRAYRDALHFQGNAGERLAATRNFKKELTELRERASSNFVRRACDDELRLVEFTLRDLEKTK